MSEQQPQTTNPHQTPTARHPSTPRIVGLDWLELPVRRPAETARLYQLIGLQDRGRFGASSRVAVGGLEISLKPKRSTTTRDGSARSGIQIQLAVDDVGLKHREMEQQGLAPGRLRQQRRGDWAFEWHDPNGHTFRFVGPMRPPD